MVEYDKIFGSLETGICELVATEQERRIKRLWEKAEETGNEVAMGFGIMDGKVHVSTPMPGSQYSISRGKVETSVTGGLKYPNKQYDRIGHIHTHPVEKETMPNVMSPNDYNMHLLMADSIEGYTSSLVLTHLENNYILFGLSAEENPRDLGNIQSDLARIRGDFINHDETGDNPFELLADMEDLMLEHYEPCSYRF